MQFVFILNHTSHINLAKFSYLQVVVPGVLILQFRLFNKVCFFVQNKY